MRLSLTVAILLAALLAGPVQVAAAAQETVLAVILNTNLSPTYAEGQTVALDRIDDAGIAGPDFGCDVEHLHAEPPGIRIDGNGPFADPDPSGCGYGLIAVLPVEAQPLPDSRPVPPIGPAVPPTPTPTPPPDEITVPRLPVPEPTPEPCTATGTGWFEPVQGVWQDDELPPNGFADKPGKQLTPLAAAPGQPANTFDAELDMVQGRDSLLFGIRGDRNRIVIRVGTNCTEPVSAQWLFVLTQTGSSHVIYEAPVRQPLLLAGPAGNWQSFEVALDATDGIPDHGNTTFRPFRFPSTGQYEIWGGLAQKGGPSGYLTPHNLRVLVLGEVVATRPPILHFQPVTIQPVPAGGTGPAELEAYARLLAESSAVHIPDYFPLAPERIPYTVNSTVDVSSVLGWADAALGWLRKQLPAARRDRAAALAAALVDRFGSESKLGDGGRIIVLLSQQDFALVGEAGSGAVTQSQKVILLEHPGTAWFPPSVLPGGNDIDHWTVAHELVHSMPFSWSSAEMTALCDKDYHNNGSTLANGHRITRALAEDRAREAGQDPVMEGIGSNPYWITQCTYWHLLDELQDPPDPPLILVRGRIARDGTDVAGELFPSYQLSGRQDLTQSGAGDWRIVLRDAAGAALGSYPFAPRWNLTTAHPPRQRNIIAFAYRVPDLPGVVSIDIFGPADPQTPLDTLVYSPNAPAIAFLTPLDGATPQRTPQGTVHVEWTFDDPDGDLPLHTVFYSTNRGQTWTTVSYEKESTQLDLAVDPQAGSHTVKVIGTDGARSAEATVSFTVPTAGPPTQITAGPATPLPAVTASPTGGGPAPNQTATAAPPQPTPAPAQSPTPTPAQTGMGCNAPRPGSPAGAGGVADLAIFLAVPVGLLAVRHRPRR